MTSRPNALDQLRDVLEPGRVYRRLDLAVFSNAVDRHLKALVNAGDLQKLAAGLYYAPRQSVFGKLPPDDDEVIRGFLRDDDFLVFSPSLYNAAGLGTTQLYNHTVVYNRKRHGRFKLGNRVFDFRMKSYFPNKLSDAFLFVDLLNNADELAEETKTLWARAVVKAQQLSTVELEDALKAYGNMATTKRMREMLHATS